MMSKREDALSLELYIVLSCLTGIIGVVLLALAVFPDVDLGMRLLRVAVGGLLLFACQRATRVSFFRLKARSAAPRLLVHRDQLRQEVLALLKSGRKVAAIRLYREVMGVGLTQAKRGVERIAHEEAPSPDRREGQR